MSAIAIASWRAFAGTRKARAALVRCCWAFTTIRVRCSTSASARVSRWRSGIELAEFLTPYREDALIDHPWKHWAEHDP